MFIAMIFVIGLLTVGLLTVGIFLTNEIPIFIKKKTTTIDDLDEVLAGLNEPIALSPKHKQIAPNAYPGSTLFQFSKKETDDAFSRLTSNIRKGTNPKSEQDKFLDAINSGESYSYTEYKHGYKYEYSTDGHVFTVKTVEDFRGKVHARTRYADDTIDTDSIYVWGQEEPIATFQHGHIVDDNVESLVGYIKHGGKKPVEGFKFLNNGWQVKADVYDRHRAQGASAATVFQWMRMDEMIAPGLDYNPHSRADKSIVRKTYK